MDNEEMREKFEEWYTACGWLIKNVEKLKRASFNRHVYEDLDTERSWNSFQAGYQAALSGAQGDREDADSYRFIRNSAAYVAVNHHKECLWVLRGIYAKDEQNFDAAIKEARTAQEKVNGNS